MLREGVFFRTRLVGGELLLPDVRDASVRDLAVMHGACLPHAEGVARLALRRHDSLAGAGVVALAADERELLRAAAMLHDLGMALGYDGHRGHSLPGPQRGLAGFGPRELALIAQIVR